MLNDWATVIRFLRRCFGYEVQEPHITDKFKQFLVIMYDSNCEKRVLADQTMTIEQLYALSTDNGNLTSRLKKAWLDQFYSWSTSALRAQIKRLVESGGVLEIELSFGQRSSWRVSNLHPMFNQPMCQYCLEVNWKLHNIKKTQLQILVLMVKNSFI